ncbi:MAG: DUF2182 domain-containing protein [Alphaproteobacteria bacterium]|nr:DUF2182 domain-containing protein [Alphaproteobacteria bacterium]
MFESNAGARVPAALPGRDRITLVAGLAAVLAIAWVWLLLGSDMGTGGSGHSMVGMSSRMVQPATWTPAYAATIFVMWWVMMIAMMLPSAVPTLLLFARINRKDRAAEAPLLPTALFGAGYLLAWGAFSVAATALQAGLDAARLLSPTMATSSRWLGVGILVAAGIWQLTPLKASCLRHCRTPLSFLMHNWRPGPAGAVLMGLGHGAYCIGCCWFLMSLLFFGGVMNLYWILGIATFVLLEKTVPQGHWLGRIAGVALIVWGAVLAVHP